MSLFETLKNKYPIQQIPPYGDCIIIPRNEYQKEWEKRLEAEGYMSHIVQIDYVATWAVQLRKAEIYRKEPFPEPPKPQEELKKPMKPQEAPDWLPEDIKRLQTRWEELGNKGAMEKGRILAAEFPGRSPQAIYIKHYVSEQKKLHQETVEGSNPPKTEPAAALQTESIRYAKEKEFYALLEEVQKMDKEISNLKTQVTELNVLLECHGHLPDGKAALPLYKVKK